MLSSCGSYMLLVFMILLQITAVHFTSGLLDQLDMQNDI